MDRRFNPQLPFSTKDINYEAGEHHDPHTYVLKLKTWGNIHTKLSKSTNLQWRSFLFLLTRWRRFDFAITCISHRPQPEYTRDLPTSLQRVKAEIWDSGKKNVFTPPPPPPPHHENIHSMCLYSLPSCSKVVPSKNYFQFFSPNIIFKWLQGVRAKTSIIIQSTFECCLLPELGINKNRIIIITTTTFLPPFA